jgi:CelD/BcsL family acetyltransferase involved in cellulose biosynthesis
MNQAALLITPAYTKASHDLVVREFNHPSIFSALAGEWEELSLRCAAGAPFLTAEWSRLWWNYWHQDRRLKILALYEANGELCGIAPLCSGNTADDEPLMLIGSPDVCDYRDFIVATGTEARFFDALIAYLMLQAPRRFMLTLNSLQHHSPALSFFRTLAQRKEFEVNIAREDTAPCMDLPSDFEDYLNRLPAKERHEIRRKKRRAEKEGTLVFERMCDPARVMAAMPSFLDLFRSSDGMKHEFLTPEREGFFLSLADAFSRRGWLDLYALSLNGRAITYLLCFSYNRSLYLYNASYDNRYAHVSPGIVAIAMCIEDAIKRGIGRFEFLRGNEAYKYRFGGRDRHIYTLTCSHRGE